jgi:hypothetical protein
MGGQTDVKLNPGERSILASFASETKARDCVDALKQAGYDTVQFDHVGRFGVRHETDEERPAISGKESSNVRTVLNPAQMDNNTAILLGASSEVSGMAGGDTAGNMPYLVTVVTSEVQTDRAVALIQKHGGRV